jgi:hypothetical protein
MTTKRQWQKRVPFRDDRKKRKCRMQKQILYEDDSKKGTGKG